MMIQPPGMGETTGANGSKGTGLPSPTAGVAGMSNSMYFVGFLFLAVAFFMARKS